jgi:hypothetical protein
VMFVAVRRCGLVGVLRDGSFAAGVVGMGRIVGMGGVFARVLGMGQFVMTGFFVGVTFMRVCAGRSAGRSRLDGRRNRHVRMPFRRGTLAGVAMVPIGMLMLVGGIIMAVIMLMMRVAVLMPFMIMMMRIGGMVLVTVDVRVPVLAVKMIRLVIRIVRLVRLGVLQTGGFDDAALHAVAIAAAARIAVARAAAVGAVFCLFFGLAMGAFIRLDQRLAIGNRNLIIVRMDFAEGEKAVAVAAIFDEGGLQRRLYAGDLGEIDISTQLLALGGLEIKLFDAIAADHDDPGLFRMGSIDQHFVGHFGTLGGGGRV